MATLNKVQLIGYLGKDPEMKYIPNGTAVTKASIGVSERWKDAQGENKERTEWVTLEIWGKRGEAFNQYLHKGSFVYIEGKFRTDKWDDNGTTKYFTKVVVTDFQFLDRKNGNGADHSDGVEPLGEMQGAEIPAEDDIPF